MSNLPLHPWTEAWLHGLDQQPIDFMKEVVRRYRAGEIRLIATVSTDERSEAWLKDTELKVIERIEEEIRRRTN